MKKLRIPVAHNSRGMTEQLAGKGGSAKKRKTEGITSSSPQTVFPKKEAIQGALCPIGDEGLREKPIGKRVVLATVVRPRSRKPLCERYKHDW